MFYRLRHGDIAIGRGITHKAVQLSVNQGGCVDIDSAMNLAPHAEFSIVGSRDNARAPRAKACQNLAPIVPKARHDAIAGDDYH